LLTEINSNYNVALESAWTNGTNTQNLTISVNGGEAKRWAFPISGGDWFETGRLYIELEGLKDRSGNQILVAAPGIDPGPDVVGLEIF
jgi:alpha-galactosidase